MNANHSRSKRIFGRILLGVAMFALISLIVLLLWNCLMPAIFGLNSITYWQSAGLLFLSKILFGGFGHGMHHFFMRDPWRTRFEMKFGHRHFHETEKGE